MTPPAASLFIVKGDTPDIPAEPRREDAAPAWRETLQSCREILAGLAGECEATLDGGGEVPDVAGRLVAAAAAGARAAAERTEATLRVRIADLQEAVERTREELRAERERLAHVTESLGQETAARVRAEAALQEARSVSQQIVVRYEAQAHATRAELDAARAELDALRHDRETDQAERARLVMTLQAVHLAVSAVEPATSIGTAPIRPAPPPADVPPVPLPSAAAAPPRPAEQEPAAGPPPDPEQADYVQHLFEEAESMYKTDIESGRMPIEVVDRLAANLRYARASVSRRFPEPEGAAAALFQQQLSALLDAKGETAFGRHLSIAAHECVQEAGTGPALEPTGS